MMKQMFPSSILLAWVTAAVLLVGEAVNGQGVDDPVMAGYDLVSYHSLNPLEDGVPGSEDFSLRHDGYLYYFANQANMDAFQADPAKYLPAYGGFCAWGIAWEYPEDGWPWAHDHMGPPCGPRDGWALLTDSTGKKRLFCSIWRSYQDDFNRKQEEGIRLADQRWIEFYGSLDAGPKNNGCYAWNWQECFATSIYDPANPLFGTTDMTPSAVPTMAPTQAQTLFQENQANSLSTTWSDEMKVLNGALSFSYTLENVASIRPLLVVDLMYELDSEFDTLDNQYVGFGVAEQVMQGALVVCSPRAESVTIARSSDLAAVASTCKTYMGSGMGITGVPTDPVQPTVRLSERNSTHYHVQFSANLFACWSNPVWPARVLFSRGLVSGNGDPMPHRNNLLHREAVPGVEFLSVIEYADGVNTPVIDPAGPPAPLQLEPLPDYAMVDVDGTSGSLDVLQGRVTVEYGLYRYGTEQEEVVHVDLLNVPFDPQEEDEEHTYVGFGFAADTMSGLIITCAPTTTSWDVDELGNTVLVSELTATCHQWRGLGTNLYPLNMVTDAGGWFLQSIEGNGTHANYTLAGRVADVVSGGSLGTDANLRAILAIGRTAPDTGTPLMHTSTDRTPMVLDQLTGSAAAQKSGDSGAPAALKSEETAQEEDLVSSSAVSLGLAKIMTWIWLFV